MTEWDIKESVETVTSKHSDDIVTMIAYIAEFIGKTDGNDGKKMLVFKQDDLFSSLLDSVILYISKK